MKKVILILLLLAIPVLSADWAYLDDTILVGGEELQIDAYILNLECEGDSIGNVNGAFVYKLLDSVSYSHLDTCKRRNWNGFLYSSSFPTGSLAYYAPAFITDYVVIGSPTSADVCRVYHYIYNSSGQPLRGGYIIAQVRGRNVVDTCNNTIIARKEFNGKPSDSTGLCYIDLVKSKCLNSSDGKYNLKVMYSGDEQYKWIDTIPDLDSTLLEK